MALINSKLDSDTKPGLKDAANKGLLKESRISTRPEAGDQWMLINSLSCKPIKSINQTVLNIFPYLVFLMS